MRECLMPPFHRWCGWEAGARRAPSSGRRGCLKSAAPCKPPSAEDRPVTIRTPYLLFIGDAPDQLAAKTADGIAFWRPEICLGQLRLPGCKADLRIPDMTCRGGGFCRGQDDDRRHDEPRRRARRGLGRAAWCGRWSSAWIWRAGCITASPTSRPCATPRRGSGAQIHDVRHPTREFAVGNGIEAPGQAPVDGRHRLLDRQDVHGAGARKGDAGARPQGRFPRHRPDRHLHRRRRRLDRRGGLRFRLRRRSNGCARPTTPTTGT